MAEYGCPGLWTFGGLEPTGTPSGVFLGEPNATVPGVKAHPINEQYRLPTRRMSV